MSGLAQGEAEEVVGRFSVPSQRTGMFPSFLKCLFDIVGIHIFSMNLVKLRRC
jgi:hypothetical protein